MQQLIQQIEQWAEERNLIQGSTPRKQMLKLMEEFGELCGGIAKNNPEVIKDSVGDIAVVLIILKAQLGVVDTEYRFDRLLERFEMPDKYSSELIHLDFICHAGVLARDIGLFDKLLSAYPANIAFDVVRVCGSLLAFVKDRKLDFQECLELAYNQIKDRKGKMIDGVFVKEEDL